MTIQKSLFLAIYMVSSLLFIQACQVLNDTPETLLGEWKAVSYIQVYEGDSTTTAIDTITENLHAISFRLTPSSAFSYRGGFNYRESGHYKITGDKIILQDTTHPGANSRYLLFNHPHPDSLFLTMKEELQLSELIMVKVKSE